MKRRKTASFLLSLCLFGFLLGIHNGKIALYQDQDPEPVQVLPYAVSALPKEAQRALSAGIPIDSVEDIKELLEKYLP